MKEIKYSFSIGYRCNSVQFLRKYEMSKFSGPFDWMYIDIESAVENIADSFREYLTDIVVIKKDEDILELVNPKKYDSVRDDVKIFSAETPVYMKQGYGGQLLPINQNYSNPKSNDIYRWDRVCVFLHHDFRKDGEIEKIRTRISRFDEVIEKSPEDALLLYVSKILDNTTVTTEIDRLSSLYGALDKRLNIVSVLCFPQEEERHIMIDNMLFIIKKVPGYQKQYETYETDNNFEWLEWGMQGLNFDKEFKIIESYYQFNLVHKEEI